MHTRLQQYLRDVDIPLTRKEKADFNQNESFRRMQQYTFFSSRGTAEMTYVDTHSYLRKISKAKAIAKRHWLNNHCNLMNELHSSFLKGEYGLLKKETKLPNGVNNIILEYFTGPTPSNEIDKNSQNNPSPLRCIIL